MVERPASRRNHSQQSVDAARLESARRPSRKAEKNWSGPGPGAALWLAAKASARPRADPKFLVVQQHSIPQRQRHRRAQAAPNPSDRFSPFVSIEWRPPADRPTLSAADKRSATEYDHSVPVARSKPVIAPSFSYGVARPGTAPTRAGSAH